MQDAFGEQQRRLPMRIGLKLTRLQVRGRGNWVVWHDGGADAKSGGSDTLGPSCQRLGSLAGSKDAMRLFGIGKHNRG